MKKYDIREWIALLEAAVDKKLEKWKKEQKIENGEAVQLRWQFEQSHIMIDVFGDDNKEAIHFQYSSPRVSHRFEWDGLTDKTFNRVMDRVGNLAQITMHPVIDPEPDLLND